MTALAPLPIDAVLPELLGALAAAGRAVLQAPPGAGKTTRVPPAILSAGLAPGRILMLEPRRLAARAAAERMAAERGSRPGETVGYRMRGESRIGPATRIEVVTEGILTRMIQSDPELSGIGAILFDEFHERSLHADLGLALALECRAALRPDLILVVMSATLDVGPVAALMEDAPIVTAEGRAFPVETRWLDRPLGPGIRLETAAADLILSALAEGPGGVLAFLPGEGEIRRTAAALAPRLPAGCRLRPLYGALAPAEQRAAIAPEAEGLRKVVLSTAIAETSLTIEDIRIVVDAGRARRARFDPGSGMSRLVTERVTRAEAAQRAGRAGRVAPGTAWRLWTRGEEGAMADQPPPEIAAADLAALALDLALWGSDRLPFLTTPPEAALAEARALLRGLGALDEGGGITPHGRVLAALPLHPRLAHMVAVAGPAAAPLAALLSERDAGAGPGADVAPRLRALAAGAPDLARARQEARRIAAVARRAGDPDETLSPGAMAALAYPDRVALRRPGEAPRYLLSGGKGARLDPGDGLAAARFLVATDLDGDPRESRIRRALSVEESEIRALLAGRIAWERTCAWDTRAGRVLSREEERLGALTLDSRPWDAPAEARARAMCDGVRALGLRLSGPAKRLVTRVRVAREGGADLPEFSDEALLATLEDWLAPFLGRIATAEDWRRFDPLPALQARLGWEDGQRLEAAAPGQFTTPLGRRVPIDYETDEPGIAVRLQEMFGQTEHPLVAGRPLRLTLLSPAGRPIQITADLPGFWATSYAEVRKDMRGRYPKHPWPEDPTGAAPTLRARTRH